jgi:50S ribosomal subunit-associated GTPase HflX
MVIGPHNLTNSVRQFENQVSDIMMKLHRVAKRTDISRNGKNQRGFAHVGLKRADPA